MRRKMPVALPTSVDCAVLQALPLAPTRPVSATARRSRSLAATLLSQALLLVLPAQLATLLAPGLVLATFLAPGLVLAQLHLLGQLSLAFPPEFPALRKTCELPCLLFCLHCILP